MDVSDYYAESLTSKIAYNLGRGVKAVQVVAMENINPLKAGATVAAAWGSVSALMNLRRYKKGKIAKREAVLDSASQSVGMGLSAGLGLFASNAARTSLVAASAVPSLIPFTVGVIVTSSAKTLWDSRAKKLIKRGHKDEAQDQNRGIPAPAG